MELNEIVTLYFLCVFVVLVIGCSFIMWIIKKSVKNAIVEVIDEDALFENIKLSVAEGVLMALEEYNNGNEKKRKT